MFETAELGHEVDKATYEREAAEVRAALLEAQRELALADVSVVVIVTGVGGAGKSETVNLLLEWLDARGIQTHAMRKPSGEERRRPPMWRFWRDLPPRGRMGIFFGAWYAQPILDHVFERTNRLELDQSLDRIVDRYGKHTFGRSLLMARRLIEAGVPIVQATMGIVQTWDTHVANFPRLKDSLMPPLDRAVSTLLDDLESRGLLDETLVVMLSEFGRTPKITPLNPGDVPGRDHWPKVFPAVFAGAGVVGGQVIGKSDKLGAYPLSRSFGPPDLAATIYSALGVDPATELRDRLNRPLRLCSGEVMTPLYSTAAI
jgi:Protein of unknown function (DUF1501)/Polyphosphate kinase 2 (PPK2)